MIRLLQWNIQGFQANRDELDTLISLVHPSVICLQETFLRESKNITFKGFSSYQKPAQKVKRGTEHSDIFYIFANTLLMIASFLLWCHLCTRDSTLAILSWSGFRLINRDTLSLFFNVAARLVYRLPHHRRSCNTALAASARTCRFQGGSLGFSHAARSCSTLLESADPRRRSARSSPTLFMVITTTASSTIPSVYCPISLVSCSSIPFFGTPCRWTFSDPPLYLFRQLTLLFHKAFPYFIMAFLFSPYTWTL